MRTDRAAVPRGGIEHVLGFPVTDEQWDCISAPLEPLCIVAGAGTGKTTVMAARVLYLVAGGLVAPDRVLGLTFTNKAAAELGTRVDRLLRAWRERRAAATPMAYGEPTVSTYHAFAARLIGEQGLRVSVEPGARLLREPVVAQLAVGVVRDAGQLGAEHAGPSQLVRQLVHLDGELAEQAVTTEDLRSFDSGVLADLAALPRATAAARVVRQTSLRRIDLAELVDELRRRKARAGVDFSDQMRLGVQLVTSSAQLGVEMRQSWGVVLLDEYQDTSIAQRIMLATLFHGHPVTAVGDPLQAIYGWRSASVANIDAFPDHFGAIAGSVKVLSVNRRSGEAILDAANTVSTQLRHRHPQVAALRAPSPRRARVCAALLETAQDERAWIAQQVAELVAAGRPPGEIAVLARVGRDLGPLCSAILTAGVPAVVAGREDLLAQPEAGQVVAILRMISDPLANGATAAVLSGPRWQIGPADLALLAHRAAQLAGTGRGRVAGAQQAPDLAAVLRSPSRDDGAASLLEAALNPGGDLALSSAARDRLARFAAELADLQQAAGAGLVELASAVIDATGAAVEWAVGGASSVDGLGALMDLVGEFADAQGDIGLPAFLACLDLAEEFGRPESVEVRGRADAVQLMTVHKAKGLEWPVVILAHLCQQVFPSQRPSPRWPDRCDVVPVDLRDDRHVLPGLSGYSRRELEQYRQDCRDHDRSGEDRLAYVALTRARDLLIGSGHWWGPTQRTPRGPSPYLLALREHDVEQDARPWAPGPPADEAVNPALAARTGVPWPVPDSAARDRAAREAVEQVLSARQRVAREKLALADLARSDAGLSQDERRWLEALDADLALLVDNLRAQHAEERAVPLPEVLSASQIVDLAADPQAFARRLARPMPRPPSQRADLGTQFHAWVEGRLGLRPLIADEDLPGAADAALADPRLGDLQARFERLEYARMVPFALEERFALPLAGRIIRGRIDAVFRHVSPTGVPSWEVVDWKTSGRDSADPLQLAVYRLAWARRVGVDVDAVSAAFVYVGSGRVVRPQGLPAERELIGLLGADQSPLAGALRGRGSRRGPRSGR